MHITTKKMAFAGLTLALAVLAIVLSGVLEINTFFLLAAAAYLNGVVIRECGIRFGTAFYLAAILLGLLLAPNKLYCVTFGALGFYILAVEFLYPFLGKLQGHKKRRRIFWIIKYLVFNLMYLPILIFLPTLLFPAGIHGTFLLLLIAGGQIAVLVYDKAYEYFQIYVWGKFRKRLGF